MDYQEPKSMNILLTGATGTFGQAFLHYALTHKKCSRLAAFARSESRLALLTERYGHFDAYRPFLGDVRDEARLRDACRGMDVVVHAAALKRVDDGAYNPLEMHKTNVQGSINVAEAARLAKVDKVILLSSDKAVAPINTYGASKYQAENCLRELNTHSAPYGTLISAVRYGNVLASTGSVLTVWSRQKARHEPLTLTDAGMTRFWMTPNDAVQHVFRSIKLMRGGEVILPCLRSSTLETLAHAYSPRSEIVETGKRPGGEKPHEVLINEDEQERAVAQDGLIVVPPAFSSWTKYKWKDDHSVDVPSPYASNVGHLCSYTVSELRDLILKCFAESSEQQDVTVSALG
jgi:UDP-N-acetylglucosamine 4,6-dehydratase